VDFKVARYGAIDCNNDETDIPSAHGAHTSSRLELEKRGASCGLCFGILSPLVGSLLTAISWFTGPYWHGFFIQRDGTVLLFLTIPFLIFGAHCLDLMDKEEELAKGRRRRVAYFHDEERRL
jgi:hypothetical protein